MDEFSSYKQVINYLFGLERQGIKYNLNNIRYILDYTGNPQTHYKTIHIAGTNGKGSVSSFLNSILIEAGYKTGLYTSPHILDFRERIQVNGKYISKKFIVNYTEKIKPVIKKIKPSFFEVTTAMAFEYFKEKKTDIAVIETGLGGRLDSTNVLNSILSVITAIDIDHTTFLGNTIEKITKEKAGIIKKNSVCVMGKLPGKSRVIISNICNRQNSVLINSDKMNLVKNYLTKVSIKQKYQFINLNTVLASIKILKEKNRFVISEKNILNGIKKVSENSNFHGRFEEIHKKPIIITDVSHNKQALSNLRENLKSYKYRNLNVIFGIMSDKEINECVKEIESLKFNKIILTQAKIKRSLCSEELFTYFRKKNNLILTKGIADAVKYAKSIMNEKDLLLVTGSFYIVSDFLNYIKRNKIYKNINI